MIAIYIYISVPVFIYLQRFVHMHRSIYISIAVFIYQLQHLRIQAQQNLLNAQYF